MKRRQWVRAAAGAAVLGSTITLLVGCASPQIADYARETPRLDLRKYFDGPLLAHGIEQPCH
ncbi:MAG: DUF3833 family protein [Burkholderiaceae bacterium]